jgi:hypothetical protein
LIFPLPYFAFLGMGFMFVEIPLIQKMILPLENPPYAMATVMTSMLVSSGAGSMLSHKYSLLRRKYVLLAISALVAVYSLSVSPISEALSPYALHLRIGLTALVLFPLGFLMGIPLPLGMKNLGDSDSNLIPWAWAVNGCVSVLSPVAAAMIAMMLGFRAVLWLGAAAYLFAFFAFPSCSIPNREGLGNILSGGNQMKKKVSIKQAAFLPRSSLFRW